MGYHSAPGLFCSLPMGLSCLFRPGALWDLRDTDLRDLLVQQWSFHSWSPGNPAGITLTVALGQWESSHRVPLELDKAPGPFETHHSGCWSKSPAPGFGFMECQRSGVGTIPDIVPVSSSWHSIKQSLGRLFWAFHGHPLTESVHGVRLMPHLISRTTHQPGSVGCTEKNAGPALPLLCYLLQLWQHFWLSHLPCTCLIGQNKNWLLSNQTWFWTPKYCPRWTPTPVSCRWEICEVLHQGSVKRRKQEKIELLWVINQAESRGRAVSPALPSSDTQIQMDTGKLIPGVILHC